MKITMKVKLICIGLLPVILFLALIAFYILPSNGQLAANLTEHNLLIFIQNPP